MPHTFSINTLFRYLNNVPQYRHLLCGLNKDTFHTKYYYYTQKDIFWDIIKKLTYCSDVYLMIETGGASKRLSLFYFDGQETDRKCIFTWSNMTTIVYVETIENLIIILKRKLL